MWVNNKGSRLWQQQRKNNVRAGARAKRKEKVSTLFWPIYSGVNLWRHPRCVYQKKGGRGASVETAIFYDVNFNIFYFYFQKRYQKGKRPIKIVIDVD